MAGLAHRMCILAKAWRLGRHRWGWKTGHETWALSKDWGECRKLRVQKLMY